MSDITIDGSSYTLGPIPATAENTTTLFAFLQAEYTPEGIEAFRNILRISIEAAAKGQGQLAIDGLSLVGIVDPDSEFGQAKAALIDYVMGKPKLKKG